MNLSIRYQILVGYLLVIGFMVFMTISALQAVNAAQQRSVENSDESVSDLQNKTFSVIRTLTDLQTAEKDLVISAIQLAVSRDAGETGSGSATPETLGQDHGTVQEDRARVAASLSTYLDIVETYFPEETEISGEISAAFDDLFFLVDQAMASDTVMPPIITAIERLDRQRLTPLFEAAIAGENAELAQAIEASKKAEEAAVRRLLVSGGLSVLLAVLGGWTLSNRTSVPIRTLRDGVARVASGDLGVRFDSVRKDEIGDLVTGFNAMTDRLREMTSGLEKQVEERTAQYLAAHQARMSAEEANKAKTEFLTKVSHELRTPLIAVIGLAELILDDATAPLEGFHRDYVAEILRSGRRLEDTVNSILNLGLLEAGKIAFRPQPVDLVAGMTRIRNRHLPTATARRMELTLTLADDLPPEIETDPALLFGTLEELIENALIYPPDGSRIEISARLDHGSLTIDVQDDGPGIPDQARTRIFEAFEQADNSLTRLYEGAGLGLTRARRMIGILNGDITLVPCAKGAHFRISVPMGSKDSAPGTGA